MTSRFFPAADVTAIDTTGGADAFISALAVYLTEGLPLEKAIEIATCAASFCVARLGVVPALVDKTTLEAYVSRVHPGTAGTLIKQRIHTGLLSILAKQGYQELYFCSR